MPLKNLQEWTTSFKESRVQESNLTTGDFLSSETSVLVSGPPVLSASDALSTLIPIGLVQNFNINQGKQIFTFNEIGSSKPFMIPGRTRTSANISRILFDGPSLMYAINLSNADKEKVAIEEVPKNVGGLSGNSIEDWPSNPWDSSKVNDGTYPVSFNGISSDPGQFFINLRSSFFNKPIGLGVVLYDNESEAYGGFYLEECYINGHNMSLASQSVVIMENVSLFATNIIPLNPSNFDTQ